MCAFFVPWGINDVSLQLFRFRFHSEYQLWLNHVTISESNHDNDDHMWVHSNSKDAPHIVLISKWIAFHVIVQLWRNNWLGLVSGTLRNCAFPELSGASVIRSILIPLVFSNQWLQFDHLIASVGGWVWVCVRARVCARTRACITAPWKLEDHSLRF